MVTGIILASGFSKRMGRDKLLIEIQGVKIIERVIKACVESKLDEVILVYRRQEVNIIGQGYKIKTIHNVNADKGQSESMKAGIRASSDHSHYMFIVGDQPLMDVNTINRLIGEYERGYSPIIMAYYNGKRAMPTILLNIYREELLSVVGDKGGRDIIKRDFKKVHIVDIEDERPGIDIDFPEDVARLENHIYMYQ